MRASIPEECLLSLPAEITPELARTCADKMNHLLQVQLLGQSVTDVDSAFRLLVDLAHELASYDRAVLLWREDPDSALHVRTSRGFASPVAVAVLRDSVLNDDVLRQNRSVLISPTPHTSPALTAALAKMGASSILSTPMYIGEQVMGALLLFREEQPPFRIEEAHLIRVFTFMFESVLENVILSERPRETVFMDRPSGLFNRRYFEQQLEREMDRARRNNEPVSVLVLDLQGFDGFRQHAGQASADALIQGVAHALLRVCRKSDTLARYQDDRFAAILPRTAKDSLGLVARRVVEALEDPLLPELMDKMAERVEFNVSTVAYPDDAFSPQTVLEACVEGIERARESGGRYYQFPSPVAQGEDADILDTARIVLFSEPILGPSRLLRLFARLCLDTVPADRVSIMVREGDDLVIQVAFGFEAQEEIIRTTRVPLTERTISAWVAQRREPLLVSDATDYEGLPVNKGASYRGDSFFSYPLLNGEDLTGVIHFSNRSDGAPFTDEDVQRFAPLARVVSRYVSLGQKFGRLQENFLQDSLFGLVDMMESQIPGMDRHSQEVARLAGATAQQLGCDSDEIERIWVSSRLHDLGKVSYRTKMLSQPRALSPRERALTQRHPLLGWKFLEDVPLPRYWGLRTCSKPWCPLGPTGRPCRNTRPSSTWKTTREPSSTRGSSTLSR
jgi:diguanylate cyclase (GGDEF)-like protein